MGEHSSPIFWYLVSCSQYVKNFFRGFAFGLYYRSTGSAAGLRKSRPFHWTLIYAGYYNSIVIKTLYTVSVRRTAYSINLIAALFKKTDVIMQRIFDSNSFIH